MVSIKRKGVLEASIQASYDAVPEDIREDIVKAGIWRGRRLRIMRVVGMRYL